jgi:DNA-binding NarL/FixJ family response regulator
VSDCGLVLIVDDDASFRAFVRTLMERAGFATTEAGTGMEAIDSARARRPDAVLLDVTLPDANGLEVCRELHQELGENLPVVFVSGERIDAHDRVAGFLVGADDYVVKPFDPDELLVRIRRVTRNSTKIADRNEADPLTAREREVLALLAQGNTPSEIAEALTISTKTVSTHLQRVLSKLGVNSRAQAVAWAYSSGLIPVDGTEVEAHMLLPEGNAVAS